MVHSPRPYTPSSPSSSAPASTSPNYALLVIDCLRIDPHSSHYGLAQAVETARRLAPSRTYLTGFSHELTHAEWVSVGKKLGHGNGSGGGGAEDDDNEVVTTPTAQEQGNLWEAIDGGVRPEFVRRAVDAVGAGEGIWLRPGYDGMRIGVRDGKIIEHDGDHQ